jgi:hypothetical protein
VILSENFSTVDEGDLPVNWTVDSGAWEVQIDDDDHELVCTSAGQITPSMGTEAGKSI